MIAPAVTSKSATVLDKRGTMVCAGGRGVESLTLALNGLAIHQRLKNRRPRLAAYGLTTEGSGFFGGWGSLA